MLHQDISRAFAVSTLVAALLVSCTGVSAQSETDLTPGDVVRVNHDFVGTVMSIDQGSTLTVIGEGKPTCWPGIQHGEAPRCDPAPSVRRVVEWPDVTLERQLVEVSYTRRMIVGAVLGAAALGPVGYATGPSLGYGKIDGCVEISDTRLCTNPLSMEEFEELQTAQDQRRGSFAFGLLGASIGAIIARKTANQWIEVHPPGLGSVDGAWHVDFKLPVANR